MTVGNSRGYTNSNFLDALKKKVLIYDGAMGTSLQTQDLTAEDFGGKEFFGCNDVLVLTSPDVVRQVHRSFLEVGVDVIETNTFRSNRLTLAEYGLQDKVDEINYAAASLARQVADEFSVDGQPRFIAGSMGPTGKLPSAGDPDLSDIGFDELADLFREQAESLLHGGVDVLLIETSQDILEVKAAIEGIQQAFNATGIVVPIQAQITLDTSGRMLLGTDTAAALSILEGLPIDVIGLNCSTGPEHMRQPIAYLGENTSLPVSAIPNAGLPLNVDGEAVYPLKPEPYAEAMMEFVEKYNVSIVGGCCGTTPEHLALLVNKLQGTPAPTRPDIKHATVASPISAYDLKQEPPPFIIGERCNAQGSRKFKRLLLENDFDAIIEIARGQVDYGAHALDISVAVTELPDEAALMHNVIRQLTITGIEVPLVIDTTEPRVMEAALKAAPGRCIINSTHLESGPEKAHTVFALAKKYNAAVLILTIDEKGMAKTANRKIEIAHRLYDIAVSEHGLHPQDMIFDTLTFTLATGDSEYMNAAIDTIEGFKRIKEEMPGVFTSLGVSNLSFGLSKFARPVLNSIFLYHCVKAGLDMAIVNPIHTMPYTEISENERELAEDLIFNRREDALQRFITFYETSPVDGRSELDSRKNPTEGMSFAEIIHYSILHRRKESIEDAIDGLIRTRIKGNEDSQHAIAVTALNSVLLPAMKEVGDKFGAGELILPFVLQSAEVMKKAVSHLEQYLDVQEGTSKGTIVLATVYGDVHDIGKNLVKTILSNNGYKVIDLGKQVPVDKVLEAVDENNADAIGLSALLVSTSKQMPLLVNELQRREITIPVLVGGAAINRRFGRRIAFTENDEYYAGGVFYCKDAFEGLNTLETLNNPVERDAFLNTIRTDAEREVGKEVIDKKVKTSVRSDTKILTQNEIPRAPYWGHRLVQKMPLESVMEHIDKRELFRLSWGAKNKQGAEWEKLEGEFEEKLRDLKRKAIKKDLLNPQGVYGYFPAQSDGNELVIFDPQLIEQGEKREITRFSFPRQDRGKQLCLADYFSPTTTDVLDTAIFQVVTVDKRATEEFDRLEALGAYSDAYFFHGLAVQTAEAAAEYLHLHIKRELEMNDKQGKRYSWGYPSIPDLDDHRKVFDLLPAERELGMSLTSAYQLVPEQSTAAIILHHPDAKYFN